MAWLPKKSTAQYASITLQKPRARTDDLVIEELEGEVLVLDSKNKRAHCLSTTAARVWRACDGSTDLRALAETLELDDDVVTQAVEELEALELLDNNTLNVVQAGNGNGNGMTRRQLTKRSARVGAGLVAAPLVYSINVSPAFAILTPIPFQCEVYTVRSCGTSTACGNIAGCCCCCQGGGSCKTCGAVAFCIAGTQPCAPIQGGGFGTHCSSVGNQPADPRGCCGLTGSDNCGCGFGPFGGCCDQNTGDPCVPSASNPDCYPCCAGEVLTPAAQLGCCTSATVNCCSPSPPACCATNSC